MKWRTKKIVHPILLLYPQKDRRTLENVSMDLKLFYGVCKKE